MLRGEANSFGELLLGKFQDLSSVFDSFSEGHLGDLTFNLRVKNPWDVTKSPK